MAKFFEYERHSDDEVVFRFKLPKKGDIGRVALKEGLIAARSVLQAVAESIDEADKVKDKPAKAPTTRIEVK